jgi:hypothetical protein
MGDKLNLDNQLDDIERLGDTVVQRTAEIILPKVFEAFAAGREVAFGDLAVSESGVRYKKKRLPWCDIDNVDVDNGRLVFQKKGKYFDWVNVPVATFPNFAVFTCLIDQLGGGGRPGSGRL